jgi:hypothetical protein
VLCPRIAAGDLKADVSQVELEHFQQAADLVAAAVVADKARLGALAPCSTGTAPRDCARSFVENFGAWSGTPVSSVRLTAS